MQEFKYGGVGISLRQIGLNTTVHAEWVQLQSNEVMQQPGVDPSNRDGCCL
jgi:hypothetical protein